MDKRGVFLLNSEDQWDILEEAFKLPVAERTAFIIQKAKEKKVQYLGQTDKNVNELATELIKKGVKAKGYGKPPKNTGKV